jgi:hypothetical protein
MKGTLTKTEQGWMIIYDQILGEGIVKRNQHALPLHPDDVKQINRDAQIFDNIEARIAAYPKVEFEIVKEYVDSRTNDVQSYAKLTQHSVDPKENMEGNVANLSEHYATMMEDVSDRIGKHLVKSVYRDGYDKAKETLYTEGQMRKCWNEAFMQGMSLDEEDYKPVFFEDFIELIKNSK